MLGRDSFAVACFVTTHDGKKLRTSWAARQGLGRASRCFIIPAHREHRHWRFFTQCIAPVLVLHHHQHSSRKIKSENASMNSASGNMVKTQYGRAMQSSWPKPNAEICPHSCNRLINIGSASYFNLTHSLLTHNILSAISTLRKPSHSLNAILTFSLPSKPFLLRSPP